MPKNITVTFATDARITIEVGPGGAVKRADIQYTSTNGGGRFDEQVVVGNGAEFAVNGIDFGTIGTAPQRTAFVQILQAVVAAGRLKIGDV